MALWFLAVCRLAGWLLCWFFVVVVLVCAFFRAADVGTVLWFFGRGRDAVVVF